jgi:hypothetical protein
LGMPMPNMKSVRPTTSSYMVMPWLEHVARGVGSPLLSHLNFSAGHAPRQSRYTSYDNVGRLPHLGGRLEGEVVVQTLALDSSRKHCLHAHKTLKNSPPPPTSVNNKTCSSSICAWSVCPPVHSASCRPASNWAAGHNSYFHFPSQSLQLRPGTLQPMATTGEW